MPAEIFPDEKKRRAKAAKTLLPTNAPYPFCDPQQLEAKEPKKGSFEVTLIKDMYRQRVDGEAIKIERAWADVGTEELKDWIRLFCGRAC